MKSKFVRLLASALVAMIASTSMAEDTLWKPADFEGAYVHIFDNAKNGCWTNIRESRAYAEGQLELSGFNVVDKPEENDVKENPIFTENYIALLVDVRAARWDNGICVGHVMTTFLGSVAPRKQLDVLIINPIGFSQAWTIWDKRNLNNYVLDHIKRSVTEWVESGKINTTVE